jgi:drug/metabolite transporter (DMT)-like permease
MLWMLFALASTFFWAGTNMFDKVLSADYFKNPLPLTASFGLVSIVFSITLLIIVGLPTSIPLPNLAAASAAGLLVTIGIIPYVKALSLEEASRVIPLWHLSPLFTLILATIFLNEVLTLPRYAAFAFILMGGIMISLRRTGLKLHLSPAISFMVFSSMIFGFSDVLLKFAYSTEIFWQTFVAYHFSVSIGYLSLFVLPRVRREVKDTFISKKKPFVFVLIMSMTTGFIGFLFYNMAVLSGPISLVSVFISFQSLFVLLMATALAVKFHTFRNESFDVKTFGTKLIAIAFMAIGLILLTT